MTEIEIGNVVYTDNLTIPVGTVLDVDGNKYVREVYGWHTHRRVYPRISALAHSGAVESMTPLVETLPQYQQRFAVTCLHMGVFAGGGGYLEGARAIVSSLDIGNPLLDGLRVGSWVSQNVNLGLVPEGSVLLAGAADRAEGHTLFVKRSNYPIRVAGPRAFEQTMLLRVVALPEDYATTPWPEVEGDPEELIRQFQIRAWDRGVQEKMERGWCGDFESSMSVLSLDEQIVQAMRSPGTDRVDLPLVNAPVRNRLELESVPIGTVITEGEDFTATKIEADLWDVDDFDQRRTGAIYIHPGLRYVRVGREFPTFEYGEVLTNALQQECALGAVFAYDTTWGDDAGETRYIMARSDDPRATRGTIGLTHPNPGSPPHHGEHHRVIWDGTSPIHEQARVRNNAEMALMPVGTVVGQSFREGRPGAAWRKGEDGNWCRLHSDGSVGTAPCTLSTNPLRYVHIPVPGVDHTYLNPER